MRKVTKPKRKSSRRSNTKIAFIIRMAVTIKNLMLIPAVSISVAIVVASVWFYFSGYYDATTKKIHTANNKVSSKAGLVLEDILLEGQNYTPQDEILKAIAKSGTDDGSLTIGEPILNINLWKIKKKLEELPWVRHASVERQFPSTLSVSITERAPIALWQNGGKVNLIDDEGKIINDAELDKFTDLLIMVGKDAPSHMESVLGIIRSEPAIANRVSSVIRVSDRRWNIRLRNNIEIKLPEDDPERAWKYLAQVQKDTNILDGDVKNIDLRVAEKIFVK
jgi:cell division protein FtsQ